MGTTEFRSAPDNENKGWPTGLPYIMSQEFGERIVHHLKRSVLKPLLEASLLAQVVTTTPDALEAAKEMARQKSTEYYHMFLTGTYLACLLGGVYADRALGKYKNMLYISIMYLLGCALFVVGCTTMSLPTMGIALTVIAVASGTIKSSAQPHMADQFGASNWGLVGIATAYFYMAVNSGALLSGSLGAPIRNHWGYPAVYIIASVILALSTFVFWLGRKQFAHVPPSPGGKLGFLDSLSATAFIGAFASLIFTLHQPWWVTAGLTTVLLSIGIVVFSCRQKLQKDHGFLATNVDLAKYWAARLWNRVTATKKEVPAAKISFKKKLDILAVWTLNSCFFFISMFWALFDQYGTSWQDQAKLMNRAFHIGSWHFTLDPTQINTINPILIVLLTPFLKNYTEKKEIPGFWQISGGMFLTGFAFAASTILQYTIKQADPGSISVAWQFVQYFIITCAEILVSVTGLAIAYQLAPKTMKSTVSACFQGTVAVGNIFVALLAGFGKLPLEHFLLTFTLMMFVFSVLFAIRIRYLYRGRFYRVWMKLQAREMFKAATTATAVPVLTTVVKMATGAKSDPEHPALTLPSDPSSAAQEPAKFPFALKPVVQSE